MLIIILFCSSLLGEPPVVTITILSIRVQTLQSTVACPAPAELIPPARRFSLSLRSLWGQTTAWVTLSYLLQRDQSPPGTRELSWMPTLMNYKRQSPKLNRLSANTIRVHYKQQRMCGRWSRTGGLDASEATCLRATSTCASSPSKDLFFGVGSQMAPVHYGASSSSFYH